MNSSSSEQPSTAPDSADSAARPVYWALGWLITQALLWDHAPIMGVLNPPQYSHPSGTAINYTLCVIAWAIVGAITITKCAAASDNPHTPPKRIKNVLGLGVAVVVLQLLAYWALSAGLGAWSLGRTSEMLAAAGTPLTWAKLGITITFVACILAPAIVLGRAVWRRSD